MAFPDIDRRIVDSAADFAIIATDREGLVLRWNAGAAGILGWSEAEMLGRPVDLIFTPEDRANGQPDTERRTAQRQGRATDERWHRRKDDSRFWGSGEMFPLLGETGALVGFLKILRDRTPQHREGERLEARAGERDRTWLLSEDLMLVAGTDMTIVSVNPAWERVLGWREKELIGRSYLPLVHAEDRERTAQETRSVSAGQSVVQFEIRCRHRDGSYRWISWSAVPDTGVLHAVGRDMTAQKLAVATLRESEELYRALVTASASIVWRAAPSGKIFAQNFGWEEFTGQPPTEFAGFGWLAVIHPDDREPLLKAWEEARAAREPRETWYRARRHDGEYRWCAVRVAPVPNPDGTVREWIGTTTDMHEFRLAQEALVKSEERLRLAAEVTGLATCEADLRRQVPVWSGDIQRILGLPPEAVVGREAFVARVHPDDREQVEDGFDRLLAAPGEMVRAEFRIVRADDGSIRWASGVGRIVPDGQGRPLRYIGTLQDITDRKHSELAIQGSEARYRLLAENATDIIGVLDLEGYRRYLSPACREVLGYAPEELVGQKLEDFVHPDDREIVRATAQALASGRTVQYTTTYRHRHKNGQWVWLESRRRLLRGPDGAPIEFVSVMRDITERRQLEEQLRQAQKMEAMGQLTGGSPTISTTSSPSSSAMPRSWPGRSRRQGSATWR